MENTDYFIFARALHILGVVIWIGGVAFVTTILIPSLKKIINTESRLELFEQLEGRFAFQARIVTVITGCSGYWILHAGFHECLGSLPMAKIAKIAKIGSGLAIRQGWR